MTFDEWKAQLIIELGKTFDIEGSLVVGRRYIEDTGDDCWREMFEDGLTPSEAASEEAQAAADSL